MNPVCLPMQYDRRAETSPRSENPGAENLLISREPLHSGPSPQGFHSTAAYDSGNRFLSGRGLWPGFPEPCGGQSGVDHNALPAEPREALKAEGIAG